jgi:RNA polymerase sigma factor (sigma-70 family)
MLQQAAGESSSPYYVVSKRERRRILRSIRWKLNYKQRQVMDLRYDAGLTFVQIAALLGVKPQAISQMHADRILPALREELAKRRIVLTDLL